MTANIVVFAATGADAAIIMLTSMFEETLNIYFITTSDISGTSISLIAESGIELYVSAPFEDLRNMSAEEFVQDVLIDKLKAKTVFCGYNYRFAKGAEADTKTLRTLLEEKDAKLFVLDEIATKEGVLSSSLIRNLMKEGEIKRANALLLRNYSLSGKVIHGNALGRNIIIVT